MKHPSRLALFLLALLLMARPLVAANPHNSRTGSNRLLTDEQMRRIARVALRSTQPAALRLPGLGFERQQAANGYVSYEAAADVSPVAHVAFVVIDPRTGDAWDGVTECGEITSPSLRELQRSLRRSLGLSEKSYQRIKRRGPMCEQQQVPPVRRHIGSARPS